MLQDTRKQLFWLLLFISCFTILPFLGLTDFHTKGEPREAIVSFSMIDTGNWILPSNAGGDIAYKPPFFHWCIALFSLLSGYVTEFTSRLPSAVALIAMVMSLFVFWSKRTDVFRAFLASLITLTAFEVHRAGMNARVDMVLTAMIVLALLALYRWWEKGMKGIPFWAILFMSAGTLTKGPVGFLLPCASCGLFLLFNKVSFGKAFWKMAYVAILACVLPALWYVSAYQKGGQEFYDLVMEENFGRFLGKMSYASHERSAFYNFVTLFTGYLPWTLLFVIALFALPYRKMQFQLKPLWIRFRNWILQVDRVDLYAFFSIVVIFTFYCIPKSKRSVYILPVYPFIALFMADAFLWLIHNRPCVWRIFGWIVAGITSVAILLFTAIKSGILDTAAVLPESLAGKVQQYSDAIQTAPVNFIMLVSFIIALAFIIAFLRDIRLKDVGARLMLTVIGLVFGMQVLLDGALLPAILNHKSTKEFAYEVGKQVPEGKIYGFIDDRFLRFYIVNFYTGNRVFLFDEEKPAEGYILVGEKTLPVLESRYPGEYEFEEVMRSPHDDTEINDYVVLYHFKKR